MRDYDLFRTSEAMNNPMVISEDLFRCLNLYSYKEFPSIERELKFLFSYYGNSFSDLLVGQQFVISEYMDIVWTYADISDEWERQKYHFEKASYLKSLQDNLILVGLYEYYDKLEAFCLLDSCYDLHASVKDLSDGSPIAWGSSGPITKFQKQLYTDAQSVLDRLPTLFGCLGYNFTKRTGSICLRDNCALSLYKDAQFDFTREGILLDASSICLFDLNKLERNLKTPEYKDRGSFDQIREPLAKVKSEIHPMDLMELDPEQSIFEVFSREVKDKLYPVGDKVGLRELVNLFTS